MNEENTYILTSKIKILINPTWTRLNIHFWLAFFILAVQTKITKKFLNVSFVVFWLEIFLTIFVFCSIFFLFEFLFHRVLKCAKRTPRTQFSILSRFSLYCFLLFGDLLFDLIRALKLFSVCYCVSISVSNSSFRIFKLCVLPSIDFNLKFSHFRAVIHFVKFSFHFQLVLLDLFTFDFDLIC